MAYQNWLCFDNAGHAQTISDFSTAHRIRNTLAARLRCPFFGENKTCFSLCFCIFCLSKKRKNEKNKKKNWEQKRTTDKHNMFFYLKKHVCSQSNTKCRLSHCRETNEINNAKKNKRFVSFLFTFCSLLSWFSFVFILFISVHFFTFPAFSFSWKKTTLPIQTTCMSTHYLVLLTYDPVVFLIRAAYLDLRKDTNNCPFALERTV